MYAKCYMVIFLGRWEIELGTDRPNVQALLGEQIPWEMLPKRFCATVEDVLTPLNFGGTNNLSHLPAINVLYFVDDHGFAFKMGAYHFWWGNNHCIHSLEKIVEM